ncbi:SGNH/GDSL hydrolase family protein [Nocardioides glacieisoli]|uniref:SGNH/GDSL hydrolase family protein n=1 Tax=Nocardioides glacieisoli TaxID=1168730 RepID=A0A4V1RK16_9ACTN|nr:SGNH/GDSL hydrolase family protein [Nocardioides glacieisoli]RYB90712.1 SGNH/GDSL hydrolase family protein [Nocardioides glacieisoli]
MFVRLAAAAVVVGLAAAVTLLTFWDPTPRFEPAADEGATLVEASDLQAFSERRIFFGHMSVGKNILSGLREVGAAHGVGPVAEVEVEVAATEVPDLPAGGVLAHALIGENRHPVGKLENFEALVRGGLGDQVDLAALKFCYVDVSWYTDVEDLFETYRQTMDRLEADFPDVRFVHMTVPLTTGPRGIKDRVKVVLGRDDNAARERYNDLMRAAYGPDQLFDIASIEAQGPDGATGDQALFGGYTSDGAHLNAAGASRVAAELVDFVSRG